MLKKDEATIAFDVGLKSGKQAFKDKVIEILDKKIEIAKKTNNKAQPYFKIIKGLILELKI